MSAKIWQEKGWLKDNTHTSHYENVPFDIPESWEWCRIDDISETITGSTPSKTHKEYYGGTFPFYKPSDLDAGKNVNAASEYLTERGKTVSRIIPPNSIAVCCIGSIGKCGYISKECTTNQQINTIIPYNNIFSLFIYYFCSSTFFVEQLLDKSSAVTIAIVNKAKLDTSLIPIPPLAEQIRIVVEIEKWFTLIDDLETSKADLQDYIKQTKSKILSLAIAGKLLPQSPDDEPSINLLKRINPSFKPCDTSYYENLPASWSVTTIDSLCTIVSGLWKGKKQPFVNVGVIRNTNFSKDFKLDLTNVAYIDVEVKQFESRKLQYGDIILEKSGGSEKQPVGRVILYDIKENNFSYSNFTSVLRIKEKSIISPQFLYYALLDLYLKGTTRTMQKQTTGIHNLMMEKYLALVVPIPPINEQQRIVSAIENIFIILDNISAEL